MRFTAGWALDGVADRSAYFHLCLGAPDPALDALARIMHETPPRDRGDGRATGQPSCGIAGLRPEAYLFGTSQGPRPEDARKDGEIRGRSRWFAHNAG
jgi:hypothetical protein